MLRVCTKCKIEKDENDFPTSLRHKSGKHTSCRKCLTARMAEWRQANKEHVLERDYKRHLFRKYGITKKQYEEMLYSQDHLCAVCRKPETRRTKGSHINTLSVDHRHDTGKIRGLLCHNCNTGLGQFLDSSELLRAAADYLERNI